MQIEMTPYGRYLYSIGKFKPHSYEFVDDDILYRAAASEELQEASHNRITNETPKMKINRAFQNVNGAFQSADVFIHSKRETKLRLDQRQNSVYKLGRSSYSSDKTPGIQLNMFKGRISNSSITQSFDDGAPVLIPQINIDYNFYVYRKNELSEPSLNKEFTTPLLDNGDYFEVQFDNIIMETKEFGSFYEKENFEIEVYTSGSDGVYAPLKFSKDSPAIVDGILVAEEEDNPFTLSNSPAEDDSTFSSYYFSLDFDEGIPRAELCEVVENLEVIDQFLDEKLDCPDIRTDRFDIYSTRVGPEDLEDCD